MSSAAVVIGALRVKLSTNIFHYKLAFNWVAKHNIVYFGRKLFIVLCGEVFENFKLKT